MRTTIDIADDVLAAAREIGRRQRRSMGDVISDLARQALTQRRMPGADVGESEAIYGFRPLPARPGVIVTNTPVDRLRDEDPDD
jgi:hypothetical protein